MWSRVSLLSPHWDSGAVKVQICVGPLQPLHEFTHFPGEHSFGGLGRGGTFLVQLPETGRDENDDVKTTEESAESEESSSTSPPSLESRKPYFSKFAGHRDPDAN